MKKSILSVICAIGLSGCSTMTIHPTQNVKLVSPPTYEESVDFYFMGLSGVHRVDVKQVCGDKKPVQMQTQATVKNSLITAITFGIYSPHTVKVWCE